MKRLVLMMNEADTEPGTQVYKEHKNYVVLTGVEKAKMYEMGYANAHLDRAELFGEIVGMGFTAVSLLNAGANDDDLRSLYFGGVRLIQYADRANDTEGLANAVRLHAYLLDRLGDLGLVCDGFYSIPGHIADRDWKKYSNNRAEQVFGERFYSEAHTCQYRLSTAKALWQYSAITRWATEQTECSDHHEYSCWFCSFES